MIHYSKKLESHPDHELEKLENTLIDTLKVRRRCVLKAIDLGCRDFSKTSMQGTFPTNLTKLSELYALYVLSTGYPWNVGNNWCAILSIYNNNITDACTT